MRHTGFSHITSYCFNKFQAYFFIYLSTNFANLNSVSEVWNMSIWNLYNERRPTVREAGVSGQFGDSIKDPTNPRTSRQWYQGAQLYVLQRAIKIHSGFPQHYLLRFLKCEGKL